MATKIGNNVTTFPKDVPLPPIVSQPIEDSNGYNKLTNVEAQRIMSVLNEIHKKVALIGSLPDHLDRRVSTVFSGDLLNIIIEHGKAEQKYKTAVDGSVDGNNVFKVNLE